MCCCLSALLLYVESIFRGTTTAEKLRGQGLGPQHGELAPRTRPEAGLGWVREGVAPSRCGGPGMLPLENF